jgi:hypothetical protein
VKSTPANLRIRGSRKNFRNISQMSTSAMKVPGSTILMWVVEFGRQNHGAHSAELSPERVPLNTIRISSSPFITAKKLVKAETNPDST